MFEVGTTIAETYRVERELGRGGMGVVLLASHTRLPDKKVAIKVLDDRLAGDEVLARFKREAHIVSMLSHPNIVHIEDYNVTPDGTPYLVLEYLQGESLARRLSRGALDLDTALTITRQVGSALAAAHARGVIHRDLKPHNIFLCSGGVVKVLDFGISKLADADTIKTATDQLLGTPQYMSPEQATGRNDTLDARCDVFSLGTTIYEMLSGKPAFAGSNLAAVVYKIVHEPPPPIEAPLPDNVAAALRKAMAKSADDRFSSVSDFIDSLSDRRGNPPIAFDATVDSGNVPKFDRTAELTQSTGLTPGTPSPAPARSRRTRPLLVGAACLLAVAATLVVLLLRHRPSARATLDQDRMRIIAAQLLVKPQIELDGHRYDVEQVGDLKLHRVKFEFGGRGYEAVEQNPDKKSRWAKLARQGHTVIQFKDIEAKHYVAVVVDGKPMRDTDAAD